MTTAPAFEVFGYDENGHSVTLHECDSVTEARRFVEGYVSREDAGGWSVIGCNAIPFVGDFEFTWERGEGFTR